jgi:alpha-beta hydrolase superfamily lysophospholipase
MTAESLRRSAGAFTGVGGIRLAFRAWESDSARASLIIVHGLGEHSGRYEEFAAFMASSGISAYALDLRGHGLSQGRRGHVPSFEVFLQELDGFRREVEALPGFCGPLFLLGQSMGGLISLRYQEEFGGQFRGAVVCSPWLATAMEVPRWKAAAAPLLSRLLPALPLRHGLAAEDLTRDAGIVAAYRSDPLVHGVITPRAFAEVSAAMTLAVPRSERIQQPLLLMTGDADAVVDSGRAIEFARSITDGDITLRVYSGHYHELLNEIGRASIHREVRDWIMARA